MSIRTHNATLRHILANGQLDYSEIELQIADLEEMLGKLNEDDPEESAEDELKTKVAALNLLEAGAGGRYEELLEILSDMDDVGIGSYDEPLTEDEVVEEVQQMFDDAVYNLPSWVEIDEGTSKDNLTQDYTTGEVCGVTFYWR